MRIGIDRQPQETFAVLVNLKTAKITQQYHFSGDGALSKLKEALNSERLTCIAGLAKAFVKIKEIPFDMDLSQLALQRFCQKNIRDFFPTLPAAFNYDFEIISKLNSKILRVVAVDAKKITQIRREFAEFGFKLTAIDVNEFALTRSLALHQQLTDPRFGTALGLALWNYS